MSSYTPNTDLWIERSRLAGMLLGCVSYGAFFLLTVQSCIALMRRPRHGGKIRGHRVALLFYVVITFILITISVAANAKYTEMIWIDLRDAPGGPLALIENEMPYSINVLALSSGHIGEWFMQALLLHRCFALWNWARCVTIPMITLFLAMIGLSIRIQMEASTGIAFYDIDVEPAYLGTQVGLNVIYTILVVYILLDMRNKMKRVMAHYDSIAFALHLNGITTMCFLSISQVQGISQLFIILRVATGRGYTHEYWLSRAAAAPTTVAFSGTIDTSEEQTDEQR
ncbi:uncharacterized protein BJ212DRAFT_1480934 [Suillus subaureus]|uniref:Uncharacterized protein n=1 Tax=Suillus subaureus TaxID=48587 RepID=A0A9P7EBL3_9AGAM|nr:uncharacterized protein BJ212DRAFT_1480934 [Suillus subaureus]KAG1816489.1 hypothetical protein BJ212DRAFT_1480934 [Suillus subaureus]